MRKRRLESPRETQKGDVPELLFRRRRRQAAQRGVTAAHGDVRLPAGHARVPPLGAVPRLSSLQVPSAADPRPAHQRLSEMRVGLGSVLLTVPLREQVPRGWTGGGDTKPVEGSPSGTTSP